MVASTINHREQVKQLAICKIYLYYNNEDDDDDDDDDKIMMIGDKCI